MREGKEHSLRWNKIGSGTIWRLKKNHSYRGEKKMKELFKALRENFRMFCLLQKKKKKQDLSIYSAIYHLNVFSDISIRLFSKWFK